MSFDYSTSSYYVIADKAVKRICPAQYKKFESCVDTLSGHELAALTGDACASEEDAPEIDEAAVSNAQSAVETVIKAVKEKSGLEIRLRYHEQKHWSDGVAGAFWEVENAIQFTPEAQAFANHITHQEVLDYAE
jgi:hypothetical protein